MRYPPPLERLRSKTTVTEDGCWLYEPKQKDGYAWAWYKGKTETVHQISFMEHHGSIPEGLWVLHKCIGHRNCWNPEHLYAGTPKQNAADEDSQGRRRPARGEKHGMSKLTEELVREIRGPDGGFSSSQIAEIYGITREQVWNIRTRRCWSHIQ